MMMREPNRTARLEARISREGLAIATDRPSTSCWASESFRHGSLWIESAEILMSKLDVAKERIAYLKLWLGIAVVTDISLFSWLLTSGPEGPAVLLFGALVAVACVSIIAFYIHKRIQKNIDALEDL